jgi:hypothetical protein
VYEYIHLTTVIQRSKYIVQLCRSVEIKLVDDIHCDHFQGVRSAPSSNRLVAALMNLGTYVLFSSVNFIV